MNFYFPNTIEPRVYQEQDKALKITRYGFDNLYPQHTKELIRKSPLASSATQILADFLNGEGFENNGDLVVNKDGHTLDDILTFASIDASMFSGGFALQFNINGLGNIIEVNHLPFEFCRYGPASSTGRHRTIVISRNWEKSANKLPQGQDLRLQRLPVFNAKTAQAETLNDGRGQVLYFTGYPDLYPLANIDPIEKAVQADISINEWQANESENGFNGLTIFKHAGHFEEGSEEQVHFESKLHAMTGPRSAGVMGVTVDEETIDNNLFESVPALNKDRLYELTGQRVEGTVLTKYGLTPELFGSIQGTAIINSQSMKDHYNYYNHRTKNQRISIARVFKSFMQFWESGPIDPGEIKKQEYETPVFKQEVVKPPAESQEEREEGESTTEAKLVQIYGT